MLDRICHDFDLAPAPLRKACQFRVACLRVDVCEFVNHEAATYKDMVLKHAATGGFLHFLAQLESMAPSSSFSEFESQLRRQFLYGYLDSDILHVLDTQVPPGSVKDVPAFRLLPTCSRVSVCVFYLKLILSAPSASIIAEAIRRPG